MAWFLLAWCPLVPLDIRCFEMTNPRYYLLSTDLSLFPCRLVLCVEELSQKGFGASPAVPLVGLASNRSATYWSWVWLKVFPGKAAWCVARDQTGRWVFEACGSHVQVRCVFLLVCGSSHSKANKDWLAADSRRQKSASWRLRHMNQLASAGKRLRRV